MRVPEQTTGRRGSLYTCRTTFILLSIALVLIVDSTSWTGGDPSAFAGATGVLAAWFAAMSAPTEPAVGGRVIDVNGREWFRNASGWHLADMCSTGCRASGADWDHIDSPTVTP